MQTVVETPTYLKAASSLFSEAERTDVITAIASDPEAGDLMPGTGGYRKRRLVGEAWASAGVHESCTSSGAATFLSS